MHTTQIISTMTATSIAAFVFRKSNEFPKYMFYYSPSFIHRMHKQFYPEHKK